MFSDTEKTATRWLKEMRKGYIRIVILILLSKKQYHGYEMMKEIREKSMGFWTPTPGGVYPILKNLEKLRYIEGEWDPQQKKRRRKTYRITDSGKAVLERALAKEDQITSSMSELMKEFVKDVLDVEVEPISALKRPPFLSIFLEDEKEKREDVTDLKNKRDQIRSMIGELQKQLQTIDKRLAKQEGKSSPNKSC